MAAADVRDQLQTTLGDVYTIERELPPGGMSRLFLATERSLDRQVVIKLLPPEYASEISAARFQREVTLTAHLQHPHILPILSAGSRDGLLYYIMPYVEGESLRQRLEREGRLPVPAAVQILREVADALARAHKAGIVHRDIKPENILLQDDHALLADFGVAGALHEATGNERLTQTGMGVGTPGYMAPEQLAGDRHLDARSDVYALAVVGYEMVAGEPPFSGPTPQAVLAAHLSTPRPLTRVRTGVPGAVSDAIARALAPDPAERFATIADFRAALDAWRTSGPTTVWRRLPLVSAAVGAAVLLLIGGAYAWYVRRPAVHAPDEPGVSVAVLAFKNIGGDSTNEPFSDGMSDEVTTALGKIEGLRVAARSSAFSFKKKNLAPQEIGRQLKVLYVLVGGVRLGGGRRRVSAQLINVATGNELWSDEYDHDARDRDVFTVQDEITRHIIAALRVHLSGAASVALAKHSTESPEAHDLYQQGRYFFAKRDPGSLRKAQDYFERAIQQDSTYALAYAGLSDTYSHSSAFGYVAPHDAFPKAKAAALRALALDSTLVEVHVSLGFIAQFYDWDFATAGREFDQALRIDPRYAEAHLFRGWYFVASNRMDDAVGEVRTAVRLDPFSQVNNIRLASVLYYARRYDEALAQARRTLELDSTWFQGGVELARAYLGLGRCAESLAALEHSPEVGAAGLRGFSGYAYARCGRQAQAKAELEHLVAEAREGQYVTHFAPAMIRAGLGEQDRAFAELDSAYAERSWAMFTLRADPAFDGVRADPRFTRLLKRVGLVS
jgi:eukaryotic-like serine/threonine-protein kinase